MNLAFENLADELVYVLTHGAPTSNFMQFEVIESGVEDENTAFAVIETPDGRRHEVKVTSESIHRDSYDIGHGIPGRVA
jgi:hypothetical protein